MYLRGCYSLLYLARGPEEKLEVQLEKPAAMTLSKTLGELAENNEIEFTGPFTSEPKNGG